MGQLYYAEFMGTLFPGGNTSLVNYEFFLQNFPTFDMADSARSVGFPRFHIDIDIDIQDLFSVEYT